MTDVTPQQVTEMGPDAVALMIDLMQRNSRENSKIALDLYDSVQRDLNAARETINRIRRNIAITLRTPHTDAMIAGAVDAALVGHDYPDPGACE